MLDSRISTFLMIVNKHFMLLIIRSENKRFLLNAAPSSICIPSLCEGERNYNSQLYFA